MKVTVALEPTLPEPDSEHSMVVYMHLENNSDEPVSLNQSWIAEVGAQLPWEALLEDDLEVCLDPGDQFTTPLKTFNQGDTLTFRLADLTVEYRRPGKRCHLNAQVVVPEVSGL